LTAAIDLGNNNTASDIIKVITGSDVVLNAGANIIYFKAHEMFLKTQNCYKIGTVVVFVGLLNLSTAAIAQNTVISSPVLDQDSFEPDLAQVQPPQVGATRLDQQFNYDGLSLEFNESNFLDFPLQAGDMQDTELRGRVAHVRDIENEQVLYLSASGQRLSLRQSALIFQLDMMDRRRVVTRGLDERGELIGSRLDLSFTGRCILPGSNPEGYCTYTPGLTTVSGGVDRDTLTPNAFLVYSEFGQEISEAVHLSLQEPGFQRGEDVVGAPLVGMSFDVINSGFVSDGRLSFLTGVRAEETQLRFVPTVARVEQTLATNSVEAAATRSVRAFVLPDGDEIDVVYLAMQLAALVLPSAYGTVDYMNGTPNASVSNNIFLALNNARTPAQSYTIFQTGRASVVHSETPPRSAAETPVAVYNGIWMGMTPAQAVHTNRRLQFIPIGDRVSVNSAGLSQGGFGTPFGDSLDAGITLVDNIDQDITEVNLQNVDDLFVQVGLDLTRQDAIRRITTTTTTDYRLVPHLSFNGNRTGGETVYRYYAGVLFSDETNAYIGTDFSLATETGWNAYARVDLYSAPDPDYRSEAELRGGRTFNINPDRQIIIGASGITELDSDVLENGDGLSEDTTQVNIFGRWREGSLDFTLSKSFILYGADELGQSTTIGVGYAPNDRISVSAQVTPWSTEDDYIDAALGANIQLSALPGDPILQMQIARVQYEVGTSSLGDTTNVSEFVLKLGLQMNF
jgi:hypothetical protein